MKIQLALDHTSLESALPVAIAVAQYVDIIELGTPLIKTAGLYGLRVMRHAFPKHLIVADLKTMDAGEYEATPFLKAGADIVTVLGAADDDTIKGVVKAAHDHQMKAQVDLINIDNKVKRTSEIYFLNGDIIGIHTGIDQQNKGQTPLSDLKIVSDLVRASYPHLAISVAGGINLRTLLPIVVEHPDIIVVGGAITSALNPKEVAHNMRHLINEYTDDTREIINNV